MRATRACGHFCCFQAACPIVSGCQTRIDLHSPLLFSQRTQLANALEADSQPTASSGSQCTHHLPSLSVNRSLVNRAGQRQRPRRRWHGRKGLRTSSCSSSGSLLLLRAISNVSRLLAPTPQRTSSYALILAALMASSASCCFNRASHRLCDSSARLASCTRLSVFTSTQWTHLNLL